MQPFGWTRTSQGTLDSIVIQPMTNRAASNLTARSKRTIRFSDDAILISPACFSASHWRHEIGGVFSHLLEAAVEHEKSSSVTIFDPKAGAEKAKNFIDKIAALPVKKGEHLPYNDSQLPAFDIGEHDRVSALTCKVTDTLQGYASKVRTHLVPVDPSPNPTNTLTMSLVPNEIIRKDTYVSRGSRERPLHKLQIGDVPADTSIEVERGCDYWTRRTPPRGTSPTRRRNSQTADSGGGESSKGKEPRRG